ncbi:hypothetical protein [Acetobacter peroxydans]|jgi:hypothetical protein|uniref:hypothetical protein n=1 Tax=Acetobacter peroxydans TaxID=104098 RepID=UPI0023536B67|nr:hypothetical protein [Acetobacter peroxydans]MCH4142802.1 hypothetical protein [Acetobacter peroxydans]MCI1394290.1 hypothetical protein [Acetobacter peroxydans]MCI1411167.1 hypothetical protein [Acetobacter peroxydans]MCI1438869.1 hypothetical protein [Acetobacter peroxydans]MCI1566264.1 hypothetical protein [Acetobacter peroxydans]
MSDTTAASALASSLREMTTAASRAAYQSARPGHTGGVGVRLSSHSVDGSSSSIQFDSTGQIVPSSSAQKKDDAMSSAVDLFA